MPGQQNNEDPYPCTTIDSGIESGAQVAAATRALEGIVKRSGMRYRGEAA